MKTDGNFNRPWESHGYSDTYDTGDNNTRKIVTRYIILLIVSVIDWCLLSQKIVTLIITDPECSAIRDICCEILFVCAIFLFMGVVVEYPITVHIENVGYLFLSDNTLVSQCAKHIYVHK